MAEHRDAEIAEVVVVLDKSCDQNFAATLQRLKEIGLEPIDSDQQNLTINGTVDASKVAALKADDCVKYVRVSMTYIADYPPGDPRDRDGAEDDEA